MIVIWCYRGGKKHFNSLKSFLSCIWRKNGILSSVHELIFLEYDVSALCPWSHNHNEKPAFLQQDPFPSSGKKVERQLFIPCRQFELSSVTGLWLIWKVCFFFESWTLDAVQRLNNRPSTCNKVWSNNLEFTSFVEQWYLLGDTRVFFLSLMVYVDSG